MRHVESLEALGKGGIGNDSVARAALLGMQKRPAFPLAKLFKEYEALTKDEVQDLSPNQLRIWRNGRMRAVANFVSVVNDKPVNELTEDDGIGYTGWWRARD